MLKTATTMLVLLLAGHCIHAEAGFDTTGPNGIDARTASTNLGLDGTGVAIGQVEPQRPGTTAFDSVANSNMDTVPTEVFFQSTQVTAGTPALHNSSINAHAQQVAGILISSNATEPGIVPNASLYSSAHATGLGTLQTQLDSTMLAIQTISTQPNVRAINHSWGKNLDTGETLDGNAFLDLGLDWSASTHDVLHVVASFQSITQLPIPKNNFNGIVVGASSKIGNTYRQVDPVLFLPAATEGDRVMNDIIAPGVDVRSTSLNNALTPAVPNFDLVDDGTSFATPHVTGTAALMHEYINGQVTAANPRFNATRSRRHEVIKASILNSADKLIDNGTVMFNGSAIPQGSLLGMTRTVVKEDGSSTWLNSFAFDDFPDGTGLTFDEGGFFPLDDEMGVGHLNASRALQQLIPGEYEPDGVAVAPIGWDFGATTGIGDINKYPISGQLTAGDWISITLAWDREVTLDADGGTLGVFDAGDTFTEFTPDFFIADDQISDLELYLVPAGATNVSQAVAFSVGAETTVEHIFLPILDTDDYEIWVRQVDDDAGPQEYGLSWWYGLADPIGPQIASDFDGDGDVDGDDLADWETAFASTGGGDADGDGDTDGADFLTWQREFTGLGAITNAVTVLEPGTFVLLVLGMPFFLRTRL